MDMRITPLTSQALAGVGANALKRPGAAADPGIGDGFKAALKAVSATQSEASRLQTQVQLGNPNVSLEETMLAMQKSQIGFQATLHVRNRMVQAYTDVMNMSV